MTDDRRWISGGQPLTRVTANIAPPPAPWEVLTADMARSIAEDAEADQWHSLARRLRDYADAVDAMTQPTRIEYMTETA